jgi:GT2 family glycosyltransferase/glycosyltransferase involved in cell wall biosynthesis
VTRILFASYSGLLGGAERVLLDCAAGVEGSHTLICPPGPLVQRARAAGLTVLVGPERGLRLRSNLRTRAGAARSLAAHAAELRRLVRDLDPELTVAWGMRSALASLALPARHPVSFDHHDFLPGPVIAAGVRAAARRAAVVTVPSAAVGADLDPWGRLSARLRVVAPGVDPERFAGLGPPAAAPAVLVLGALAPWKRPDLALEICALARQRLPNLTVRLVGGPVTGDESLPAALERRAAAGDLAGAAELAGPQGETGDELARAACLLHCAPREPFGIVLLEAMAAGRPVVAPDAGGPREILDSSCGILYSPGDARAGADALVTMLSDRARVRTMGDAGRKRVRAGFDRQRTRSGFRAALEPEIARRPRPTGAPEAAGGAEVAVVTVTHNSAEELTSLLASARRHLPGAAITVVDCASRDRSVAVARGTPGVDTIALDENIGFGRACNRGLGSVTAPVTALLNPDVELIDASLLELAAEALRADRPPRLLAPLVLSADGRRQQTAHPIPLSGPDLVRALIPAGAIPGAAGAWLAPCRARTPRPVGWAVGAALVAPTATLRRLGPFDESIFMYGEDLELGLRAAAQGIETWFWPAVRVLHGGAHAAGPAFGGEPFERLARARHEVVTRRLGKRRGRLDDGVQALTFASRWLYKRALGRAADREQRQLAALNEARDKP